MLSDTILSDGPDVRDVIVIALNTELPTYGIDVWKKGTLRLCADGGANRIWKCDVSAPAPHAIIGDLDSVLPEVRHAYESKGCSVVPITDQDSTDLEKALEYGLAKATRNPNVVILGGFSGRIDHSMANLSCLFKYHTLCSISLCTHESINRVLGMGTHTLTVPIGIICGLLPVAGPCTLSTTGLKWNLQNSKMQMGGLISSSNVATDKVVTVDTDSPVL